MERGESKGEKDAREARARHAATLAELELETAAADGNDARQKSKAVAKLYRNFGKALLTPEAEACGLAKMARAIKQQTSKKQASFAALVAKWKAHGFASEQYEPEPSLPSLPQKRQLPEDGGQQPLPAQTRAARRAAADARRAAVRRAEKAADKLAADDLATRVYKTLTELTRDAQHAGRAQTQVNFETAFVQFEMSTKLDSARGRCEIQIAYAEQASQALTAAAPLSPPQKTISYCLAEARQNVSEVAQKLVVETSAWRVAKMESSDWVTASKLLVAAERRLKSLAEWADMAEKSASANLSPRSWIRPSSRAPRNGLSACTRAANSAAFSRLPPAISGALV